MFEREFHRRKLYCPFHAVETVIWDSEVCPAADGGKVRFRVVQFRPGSRPLAREEGQYAAPVFGNRDGLLDHPCLDPCEGR
jgi:hypothetical protein